MKKKVLIIENDHDIRDIISFVLQEGGFETISIPEPESHELLLQYEPHAIIIDEFINKNPGHRLCLQLKQAEHLRGIPVIVISTANDIELIVKECKADGFIKKPFDIDDMVAKVIRILENNSLEI
jgi:two-component system, OmpR family, phosphate regulon response regulator PhoB